MFHQRRTGRKTHAANHVPGGVADALRDRSRRIDDKAQAGVGIVRKERALHAGQSAWIVVPVTQRGAELALDFHQGNAGRAGRVEGRNPPTWQELVVSANFDDVASGVIPIFANGPTALAGSLESKAGLAVAVVR